MFKPPLALYNSLCQEFITGAYVQPQLSTLHAHTGVHGYKPCPVT